VLGSGDFPSPVGTVLVLVLGFVLLPLGALLWRLSVGRVQSRLLQQLGLANLATAAATVAWRLAAAGFSTAGSTLTISVAAGLAVLAGAQLRATRRLRPRTA
jgi:hypothetical protein